MADKQKKSIWHERKRTIRSLLILLAVVMVTIMAVRYALDYIDFKSLIDFSSSSDTEEKYPNLYNASRYFFRIYYPDGWIVEGDSYGFLQDEEGLVAEMYPTVSATVTAADGTTTENQVRDDILSAKFYYREFTDEQRADVTDIFAEVTPNPSTVITGDDDLQSTHLNSKAAARIAEDVYAEYQEKTASYNDLVISEIKDYETGDLLFKYFTYSYVEEKLSSESMSLEEITHSVDVYIGVRSINYIVIVYDGTLNFSESTRNGYTLYRAEFLDILEEFRFSVFDD